MGEWWAQGLRCADVRNDTCLQYDSMTGEGGERGGEKERGGERRRVRGRGGGRVDGGERNERRVTGRVRKKKGGEGSM